MGGGSVLAIPCIPQNHRTGFKAVRTHDRKTYTSLAILLTVIQLLYALKIVRPSCEQVASSQAGIKPHQPPRLRLSNRWSNTASGCQNIRDSYLLEGVPGSRNSKCYEPLTTAGPINFFSQSSFGLTTSLSTLSGDFSERPLNMLSYKSDPR